MAYGCPDEPPEGFDFLSSLDDVTCPNCGWDTEQARLDHVSAHNQGVILAVEVEAGAFAASAGTTFAILYYLCPSCKTPFSTDEEMTLGAMA